MLPVFFILASGPVEATSKKAEKSSAHHDVYVDVECGPGSCKTGYDLKPGYTNVHVTCYGKDPIDAGALMNCGSPNALVTCVPPAASTMTAVKECDCQFAGTGTAKAHVNMNGCEK
ncbi:MAG: hypothetical protein AAF484_10135 [Pseudomonadota bacterium]